MPGAAAMLAAARDIGGRVGPTGKATKVSYGNGKVIIGAAWDMETAAVLQGARRASKTLLPKLIRGGTNPTGRCCILFSEALRIQDPITRAKAKT